MKGQSLGGQSSGRFDIFNIPRSSCQHIVAISDEQRIFKNVWINCEGHERALRREGA